MAESPLLAGSCLTRSSPQGSTTTTRGGRDASVSNAEAASCTTRKSIPERVRTYATSSASSRSRSTTSTWVRSCTSNRVFSTLAVGSSPMAASQRCRSSLHAAPLRSCATISPQSSLTNPRIRVGSGWLTITPFWSVGRSACRPRRAQVTGHTAFAPGGNSLQRTGSVRIRQPPLPALAQPARHRGRLKLHCIRCRESVARVAAGHQPSGETSAR
jgi:hypothetical protein